MKPVISYILIGIFFVFIFRSIYSLYSIFEAPKCKTDDVCYKSFLNEKPDLDLYVYVSDSSKSGNFREVLRLKKFDYLSSFERYLVQAKSVILDNEIMTVLEIYPWK